MAQRYHPVFGALIDDSEWAPSPAHVMRRAAIMELMAGFEPGRLVDMGCGAGRLLIDWSERGYSGTGIEPDVQSRALAQECVTAFDARFILREATAPEDVGCYDYLTAVEVLEHLEDPLGALTEWRTCLRPGGVLIASVPAFRRLWGASDVWAGHVQRFEPETFGRLVERAGFELITSRLYGYPIANLTRFAGNLASGLKRRRRSHEENERDNATFASGRDRSVEKRLSPLLLSGVSAYVLKMGISLQRRFSDRGIGVVVVARNPSSSPQDAML